MSQIKQFQKELEKESVITRKMLSIVPNDKYDWQPHPKSMTIRQLATHIAELPAWIDMALFTSELDFAANPYTPASVSDTNGLVEYFEKSLQIGIQALEKAKEESLSELWTLRNGEEIYSKEPKADVIRMSLNQITHHRAQLGVFFKTAECSYSRKL